MVSASCKMMVKMELEKLGLQYNCVELGLADVVGNVTAKQCEQLKTVLLQVGLELMDDKRSILIEKIKHIILQMVHHSDEPLKIKNSTFIVPS